MKRSRLPLAYRTPLCRHGTRARFRVMTTLVNDRTGRVYGFLGSCERCGPGLRKLILTEPGHDPLHCSTDVLHGGPRAVGHGGPDSVSSMRAS